MRAGCTAHKLLLAFLLGTWLGPVLFAGRQLENLGGLGMVFFPPLHREDRAPGFGTRRAFSVTGSSRPWVSSHPRAAAPARPDYLLSVFMGVKYFQGEGSCSSRENDSVAFRMFRAVRPSPQSVVQHCHCPQGEALCLQLPPLAITLAHPEQSLLFLPLNFSVVRPLCKCSCTRCGLFQLAPFTESGVSELCPGCSGLAGLTYFLWLSSIP